MPNFGSNGIFARNGGTWKVPTTVHGRLAGTWRAAESVHIKRNGQWVRLWDPNDPPQPVSGLGVTYEVASNAWRARASWTLSTVDTDRANVIVTWTVNGVVTVQTLGANATTTTINVAGGSTVSASVVVVDTGARSSTTRSVAPSVAPPDRPTTVTITRIALDEVRISWTATNLNNVSYWFVDFDGTPGGMIASSVEAAGARSITRRMDATSGTFTATVQAISATGVLSPVRSATVTYDADDTGTALNVINLYASFDTVALDWEAVPLATEYEVQRAIGMGSWESLRNRTGTSANVAVEHDTDYRFRVRALGKYGTPGIWTNVLYLSIGHPAYEVGSKWTQEISVDLSRDEPGVLVIPADTDVTQIDVSLITSFDAQYLCGVTGRALRRVVKGNLSEDFGQRPNPWIGKATFEQRGGGIAGIQPVGAGWSTSPTGAYRVVGTVKFLGIKYVTYPAVPNSTWEP